MNKTITLPFSCFVFYELMGGSWKMMGFIRGNTNNSDIVKPGVESLLTLAADENKTKSYWYDKDTEIPLSIE